MLNSRKKKKKRGGGRGLFGEEKIGVRERTGHGLFFIGTTKTQEKKDGTEKCGWFSRSERILKATRRKGSD